MAGEGAAMSNDNRDSRAPEPTRSRDWTRIHHSPVFWIGILMCLAAILIYVWSDDLSWRPHVR